MRNWYLKLCGKYAIGLGSFDNYSEEHKAFLSSGFKCPHCQQILMKSYGVADVNCYDKNGQKVPTPLIGFKGKTFECPKCNHHWQFRKTDGVANIIIFTFFMVVILAFNIYMIFH